MILSLLVFTLVCFSCCAVELQAPTSHLLFVSFPYYSHLKIFIAIARALPLHHHIAFALFDEEVQIVRNKLEPYRPVTIVPLGPMPNLIPSFEVRDGESNMAYMAREQLPYFLNGYTQVHDALFAHLQKNSYDMMVVDMLVYAAQDIAHHFNLPIVIHSLMWIQDVIDVPAWVPRGFDTQTQQQLRHSFIQRFYNHIVLPVLFIYYLREHTFALQELQRSSNRTFWKTALGVIRLPHIWKGDPILIPSPLALEFRHAYTPNYHFIGFVLDDQQSDHVKDDEQLRTVDAWLNETRKPDEFVVLVAFGGWTVLPERVCQMIIDALQFVPHMRLLLAMPQQAMRAKFHASLVSAVDGRTRALVVPWIVQQRVLAHPSVRMYIAHGGLHSIGEAVYAHVPLLILPSYADQPSNAAKVEEAGIGLILDWQTSTVAQLVAHIKLIHKDHDRFVVRLRRIHQLSELEGGARRAAKLIDGWLLTGYSHLDTLKYKLPFLVATSLDVQLAFLAILILTGYLLFRFAMFIICLRWRRKKYKQA